MNVPYSWLREYLPGAPDPEAAAQLLTISGTAVEAVASFGVNDPAGEQKNNYLIGRVVSFGQHPDADRLRVCAVDVGDAAPRQIVCGASNFEEGDVVAVVIPGATMPDGTKIREAKLRGVESHGMMLSERELGLSNEHDGIMILPDNIPIGQPLHDWVPLGDTVLELEITGNRPDCLGIHGVARELATAAGIELGPLDSGDEVEPTALGDVHDYVSVTVDEPSLCPRYMARAFTGIKLGSSPYWLKSRLAAAGMRAINNVVDVTNYVMLATGQPLHAFDAAHLAGKQINVRRAFEGEQVTTLDDVERTLDPTMLSIADADGTAVIAGIMGVSRVEVTDTTRNIVLEAACFDGPSIQRASRRLGVRSESSARFEKGLDPHAPEIAMRLATRLLVELCGAKLVPGTIDVQADNQVAVPPIVSLPDAYVERIIGMQIPNADIEQLLDRLGFITTSVTLGSGAPAWSVRVPHWRMFDVTRAIDVVEEIARFHLDQVPSLLPTHVSGVAALTPAQRVQRQLEDAAAGLGLHEAITYSLVGTDYNTTLGIDADSVVRLGNPMTVDHVELRATLVGSHLEASARNQALGNADVLLFETGRTFEQAPAGSVLPDGLPSHARERDVLAVLCVGSLGSGRWDLDTIPADFAAAAGIVDVLVSGLGLSAQLERFDPAPPFLHPGQAARVMVATPAGDTVAAGWVGMVHPGVSKDRNVSGDAVALQLDIGVLADAASHTPRFSGVSDFPPVVEDIAVILGENVAAGDVIRTAREAGRTAGELLESVEVFDRYVGAPIEDGKYSLALRLVSRSADRTLADEDVVATRTAVVDALADAYGAVLRS